MSFYHLQLCNEFYNNHIFYALCFINTSLFYLIYYCISGETSPPPLPLGALFVALSEEELCAAVASPPAEGGATIGIDDKEGSADGATTFD